MVNSKDQNPFKRSNYADLSPLERLKLDSSLSLAMGHAEDRSGLHPVSTNLQPPRPPDPPAPIDELNEVLHSLSSLDDLPRLQRAAQLCLAICGQKVHDLTSVLPANLVLDYDIEKSRLGVRSFLEDEQIRNLRDIAIGGRNSLQQARNNVDVADEFTRRLVDASRVIVRDVGQSMVGVAARPLTKDTRLVVDAATSIDQQLTELVSDRLDRSVAAAQEAATEAKEAAGVAGAKRLSNHFDDLGNLSKQSAHRWFGLATLMLSLAIGLSIAGIIYYLSQDASTVPLALTIHLAVAVLPVYGLAAYAARESSRSQETARYAARLSAQMMSLDAYTAPLPPEQRDKLRATFGSTVFSAHSLGDDNLLQPLPPELLKALTELVKAARK